jgi:N-formylmaleamate deformylase
MAFRYGANAAANGIRLHYLRYGGRGTPLIVLPGITSPAATWDFIARRLAATNDVYVLDIRGRGLSQGGSDLDYSLDTYAADVVAFASVLRFDRFMLLGHSMGARICIRLGSRPPAGLDRMIILDPPLTGPGRKPYGLELQWYLTGMRLAREGADLEALRDWSPKWPDEHLRLRAEWLHTCDETAVIQSYEGLLNDDIFADLKSLKVTTRLVMGETGAISTADLADLGAVASTIDVKIVLGAGHMIPWDNFEGTFDAIGTFLQT